MLFSKLNEIEVNGASIYVDACFILAYLDSTDNRGDTIGSALYNWKNRGFTIGISNHTFGEVINTLLKMVILRSYNVFEKNKEKLVKEGETSLTPDERKKLISLESAQLVNNIINSNNDIRTFTENKNQLSFNVTTVLKRIKEQKPLERNKLDNYYQKALEEYEDFLHYLEENLQIEIDIVDSTEKAHDLAYDYIHDYQIEPIDALHLAIAKSKNFDYFATLDGDFNNLRSMYDLPEIVGL
ncbi:hypothetical protein COI68_26020 [Priestia megaterium]|uniref:type II toxin-antitoxin system VapC family toxin n=1 Tax=Priestia megaterium TaxID=1404 RepID=UPI000BF98DD9|nr:PIN domain-containing protein [Priestia megaterium]PFI60710.1 hypothetical protein COI68_26020 [Priestia megaterium]